MNLLRLLGLGLVASSFYFLWPLVWTAVYGLITGGGFDVDFAGAGPENLVFKILLPGAILLTSGIVLVRRR